MRYRVGLAVSSLALMSLSAYAQEAAKTTASEESLPAVEVIQETPAQKASRAKKKAAPVAPIASQPSASAPAAAAAQTIAPSSGDAGSSGSLPVSKVPSAVSTVTDYDIDSDGTRQVQQVLQQQVPGVILSDAGGNPLRAEFSYRGFDASPIGGRAQGLAVYQNGIRINEAFGDTVNLDLIPTNAISTMAIVSNNPTFGLNAIGGSMSITMKDGFTYQGAEIDVMGGSFGRAQVGAQAGMKSGNTALFVATEGIREDGFRNFSSAEIKRIYGDLGFKGSGVELHVNVTAAQSEIGVTAAAPVELLDRSWSNTFTSPQDTDLEVFMPAISLSAKATDTLTLSANAYYRRFKSKVIDGNLTEAEECGAGNTDPLLPGVNNDDFLCLDDGDGPALQQLNGALVEADDVGAEPFGSIERVNTFAQSYGGTVQAVEKMKVFNRPNHFLVGMSYDHGRVKYNTSSEVGSMGAQFVVTGSGIVVRDSENETSPRSLISENDYVGIYFSNTLDVTDRLALTVGGRYNHATIKMTDLTTDFPDLNTTNKYQRFNPMVGGTYKLVPGLTFYSSYSEANRAPTAGELGCAEPTNPCILESFLTDDPPLKQVVTRGAEAGFRGEMKQGQGVLDWSAGVFFALNQDDILNVVSAESQGRGYFLNAGDTERKGIELAARYQTSVWSVYGSYALVDATFKDDLFLPAPNTPSGTVPCPNSPGDNCNAVSDGDRLPGIPMHRVKLGFDYWLTPKWKFGSDMVISSDRYYNGDEGNNNDTLPGFTRVDLHTSYDVTQNFQVYGLIKNLFDKEYAQYGTYYSLDAANNAANGAITFTDPRTVSPAQPFAAYGGAKIKF